MQELIEKGRLAKAASFELAKLSAKAKNNALCAIAKALCSNMDYIISENLKDIENARANNIREGLIDRLTLNKERINAMAEGIEQIAALPDPIGEVISQIKRPNGLKIGRVRVPLGVIGIIYEARPNVTADAAGLCVKAGNAVILRGGKEAILSNCAIAKIMQDAGVAYGLPIGSINLIEDTSRDSATALMRLNEYLDVIIPRGGAGLIRSVVENATVPAIETGTGNCHVYVDADADFDMAKNIIINAKTQRTSVCNAEEKLLVHKDIANSFLPIILSELADRGVEIIGDEYVCKIYPDTTPATEEDWETEYLDLKIGVKVVSDIDEAIAHINKYNSRHSEAIITNNYQSSQKFLDEIDAAAVYVNASTRFTDGFEFGFGAEIGIST
ncbi:MAG: glutamate-5-semialdehyde dehydrogenase, partial [Clostridia bacterium]|nr:glutamate-5-semialdehyde dehydrogenase [Clostridia bacterium]